MADDQVRVTFRFGREIEVKYLVRLPAIGDHATHGRELWVVTDVQRDASGPMIVCERASGASVRGGTGLATHGPA